jgi:hypothetical protein
MRDSQQKPTQLTWAGLILITFALSVAGCSESELSGGGGASFAAKTADSGSAAAKGSGEGQSSGENEGGLGSLDPTGTDGSSALGGDLAIDESSDGSITETMQGSLTTSKAPVDIIFAMDTSGSMNSEKSRLQSNMAVFMGQFRSRAASLDFKVHMIGSNFQFPTPDDKLFLVNQAVGSNDALTVIKNWVTGAGASVLRAQANKHFVVVTDDNATGTTSPMFQSWAATTPMLSGKYIGHGLIGLQRGSVNSWCSIANVGTEYQSLAAATKGKILSLCEENWGGLLETLANAILKKEAKRTFILTQPALAGSVKVTVGTKALDATMFTYDSVTNAVTINEDEAPTEGARVLISYSKR